MLNGKALFRDGALFLKYGGGVAPVSEAAGIADGADLSVAVRSEYIDFLPEGAEGIPAVVKEKSFSAGMLRIALETETGDEVIASRHGIDYALHPGDCVVFSFARDHAVPVEANDEE